MWVAAAVLSVSALMLMGPVARMLHTARWVVREPVAAVIVWQVIGLASGVWLLIAGAVCAALSMGEFFLLHMTLLSVCVLLFLRLVYVTLHRGVLLLRTQLRHTQLLEILTSPLEEQSMVSVLDTPEVAVYCVPGSQQRVIVTSGAMRVLSREELACAVAHEYAHCVWRHDILLWPFVAWRYTWPAWVALWFPGVRAVDAVQNLAEMIADDVAVLRHSRVTLARAVTVCALRQQAPSGAFSLAQSAVEQRVHRLLHPPLRSRRWRYLGWLSVAVVPAVPLFAFAIASTYG